MRALQDCMTSWEIEAANRAWDADKKDWEKVRAVDKAILELVGKE